MMRKPLAFFLLFLLSGSATPAAADQKDLPARYDTWLKIEVVHIITREEKEAFLKLESDELRDRFVEIFWEKRDPTPGTARNEFKREHYERIEFANKNFGPRGQKNGWRTERGRIYILLGKPKERLEFPSDSLIYPLELWFYSSDRRIDTASFFYLIFFKRSGAGDYVLYHPLIDGPQALSWKGNFDFSTDEIMQALQLLHYEVAQAALSLNPLDPGNPMSSEILLANIDAYPERMVDSSWATAFLETKGKVEVVYDFQPLQLSPTTIVFSPPDGRQQLHYGFMLKPEEIEMGSFDDEYYAAFEVISSLADKQGEMVYEKSSTKEIKWTAEEFALNSSKPLFFCDVIPIVSGDFNFTIRVRNKVSRKYFLINCLIQSPRHLSNYFSLSNLVLNFNYEKVPAIPGSAAPFRFFNIQYSPSPTNEIASFENVHIFCQLNYPPHKDGLPQVGEIRYEFGIYQGEQLVKMMTHIISRDRINPLGVSYMSRQLPVSELSPGDYRLEVKASEDLHGQSVSRSLQFSIKPPDKIARPLVLALQHEINLNDLELQTARAKQFLAVGEKESAISELRGVLARDRSSIEAATLLSEVLSELGRHQEAFEVARSVQQHDPNNRRLVLAMARSCQGLGDLEKAAGYYERLLFVDGNDYEVLNEVAEIYMHQGSVEKARERWRKSLIVNPEQPEIREKLSKQSPGGQGREADYQ
ncbi:MAG TPA: GWxTD domain-containing protein [Acidobacteriota bacterium]|nr:GWxTD domain-containing protein [Acidobacteriota bacterium]